MANFQKGDVVQLKSGGPLMTVQDVGAAGNFEDGVTCVWFDGKKRCEDDFDSTSLEINDDED